MQVSLKIFFIDLLITEPTENKTWPNKLIMRQLIIPTASIKTDKSPPSKIQCMAVYNGFGITCIYLSWLPSWLDRGALINVDAPGCGKSVFEVRRGTGRKVFILGYSCTQSFPRGKSLLFAAYKSLNCVLCSR